MLARCPFGVVAPRRRLRSKPSRRREVSPEFSDFYQDNALFDDGSAITLRAESCDSLSKCALGVAHRASAGTTWNWKAARISGRGMLEELLVAIRHRRPHLNLSSRSVLEAVLLVEGPLGSTDAIARLLGLGNRFALQRLLAREGLPSLRCFSSRVLILSWVLHAERDGTALYRLAIRSHRHPSACYRLVKEVTGLRWKEVLARGSQWVQQELLTQFPMGRP